MVRSWSEVGGRSLITSRLNLKEGLSLMDTVRAFCRRRSASLEDEDLWLWLKERNSSIVIPRLDRQQLTKWRVAATPRPSNKFLIMLTTSYIYSLLTYEMQRTFGPRYGLVRVKAVESAGTQRKCGSTC